jgi:O-acetyl-ADP-ribose deacetylase (regulator of RNase III)
MPEMQHDSPAVPTLAEIQRDWPGVTLRLQAAEAECRALELENKALRGLLEKVVEHRKKSHGELVTLVTTLATKLPTNDVGVLVSRLVEHGAGVNEVCSALIQGRNEENLLQPAILRALDKTKRDLAAAIKPLVEELIRLETPLDPGLLLGLIDQPETFFAPAGQRANRGYMKGQTPREQIVRDFGEEALGFFKDVTTDPVHNPRPRPEEIMLAFRSDFEELLRQPSPLPEARREGLLTLHRRIRQSRELRAQREAFLKLSFVLELLHYYENPSTESPDVIFAQRLPPLVEQLVVIGENDPLDENHLQQAEALLAYIVSPDYRQAVLNNCGKAGGVARTARYILTFRANVFTDYHPTTLDFVRHLVGAQKQPAPEPIAAALQFLNPEAQQVLARALLNTDRLRRADAEALVRDLLRRLGLPDFPAKAEGGPPGKSAVSPWEAIREMIAQRAAPNEITDAVRRQLHAKYDTDEVKQSWLTLSESDPMSFVRVFSLLPYLPDGQTDPIARTILEAYVTRLTHEKYAATYTSVIGALRKLYKVKADSPALVNFLTLVRWVDPAGADQIARDVGMPAPLPS